MISKEQRENIIDKIPLEGALVYEFPRKTFCFSDAYANELVNTFFTGKKPPAAGTPKHAEILLGAPGAGKSFFAQSTYNALPKAKKENTIFVSYDEGGALFATHDYTRALQKNVPDFKDEHTPVDTNTLGTRTHLWESYRPFSQFVRSLVLKRALNEGYNLIIDTTSSGNGTLRLIDRLRELEYGRIDVTGTYAPFDVSLKRLHRRVRPASDEEAITKRIGDPDKNQGAMNMILPLIEAADGLEYYYNPSNRIPRELAFAYEDGLLVDSRPEIIQNMRQDIARDSAVIHRFLWDSQIAWQQPYFDPHDHESDCMKATHAFFLDVLDQSDFSRAQNYNPPVPDL